jgi:hypothetical protein
MEEKLISLEVAKLAKAKGFDWSVLFYYDGSEMIATQSINAFDKKNYNLHKGSTFYSAPTQSFLQKWLMEKHNMFVKVFPDYDQQDLTYNTTWNCDVIDLCWGSDKEHRTIRVIRNYHKKYEEALEEGAKTRIRINKKLKQYNL